MNTYIPEELRRSQEDGNVVFFCGAGVSKAVGLPTFRKLTELILTDMLPGVNECTPGSTEALVWRAFKEDRYDEALGILESAQHGGYEAKQVREKVNQYLSKRYKNLDKHLILSKLADLDREHGRLVTTNFDHLFEKARKKLARQESSSHKMPLFIAPALPPAKPEMLQGLVYLHGKLGSSENDQQLVLTTANFGSAYMLEGWALRFIIDLFRHYHVIFIGYSVKDPIMRYLVSAIATAHEESLQQFKKPYAFAPYSDEEDRDKVKQEWKLIGITPISYQETEGHEQLWQTLENWADDHRQGIMGRRQLVVRLGQTPPIADQNDPTIRDMAWALKDVNVAKYFSDLTGERRPRPEWIMPLQKEGLLSMSIGQTDNGQPISTPLVSGQLTDHTDLNEITFQLSRWVVKCLDSQEVLNWALFREAVLHEKFRQQIRVWLSDNTNNLPPALRKIWQVLADDSYAHMLAERNEGQPHEIFNDPPLTPDATFALRIFLNRLRPIPVFKVKSDFFRDEFTPCPDRPIDWCEIDIELVGDKGNYVVQRFKERVEDWDGTLAVIADELTMRLCEAMDWFREFGLASQDDDNTHNEYRSISPHEQSKHPHAWTQLIALVRDAHDALVASGDNTAAERLARRWYSLPYPVFRRLALYTATEHDDSDAKFGLEILLSGPQPTLWDHHIMRETLRFLRKRGQHFCEEQLTCLIKAVLKGPPRQMYREDLTDDEWRAVRDKRILLRLHKLKESGVSLPRSAQEAYERIQSDQQWEPPGDHSEEFGLFISSGTAAFERIDSGTREKFEEMSIEQFIQWAETQVGEHIKPWECSGGWHLFVENNIQGAVKLLKGASDNKIWPVPPWYTVLGAFEKKEQENITKDLMRDVAGILIVMRKQELASLAFMAARWLEKVWRQLSEKLREKLWKKIWNASLEGEELVDNPDFDMTLNHAGGILGNVLYEELSERISKVVTGQNPGFPKRLQPHFELLTNNDHPSAKLARVRLAPWLFALYQINPDWTAQTFFSRMNPEDEVMFDPYLWEGYFWYSRCSPDLLTAFKPLLLSILSHHDLMPGRTPERAITLFVYLAYRPDRGIDTDETKGVFWKLGTDELAVAAAALSDMLEASGDRSSALWRDTIAPWFGKVWPKRPKDKSAKLSEQLALMAVMSNTAFPLVVEAITGLLVPEEWSITLYQLLEKEEETKLVTRHPKHTLMLLHKITSTGSNPDNLSKLLEIVSTAEPGLKKTACFEDLLLLLPSTIRAEFP